MADRPLLGIALMLGFVASAPLIDVFSKLAAETVPVGVVTAARFVVQGAIMAPVAWLAGERLGLARGLWGAVALRALCLAVSTFAFVSAVRVMPIADALAVVFVMPFLLLVLGWAAFGEAVGRARLLACAAGFGGCLLVIRPSLAAFGPVALWPLVTAASFAAYMLLTRGLAGRVGPGAMQLHTSLMATALCLPALAWGAWAGGPLAPALPAGWAWAWLAGTGAASAGAHWLMTLALRHAPSATLAPLNYLEIVSAVALGFLVFGDFPSGTTWAGIAVIVLSGLAVIGRERASAARAAAPPPAAGAPGAAG